MWFPRRLCLTIAVGTSVFTLGCSSIKSTLLQRDATNTGWTSLKACGVPVTLKVTTHLRVTVTENRLYTLSAANAWVPLPDANGLPVTERTWAHEEIKTDKLFTVDFKRPAAGVLDYDAKFKDQYFSEISGHIDDKTIADVSAAIQGIIGVLPKGSGAGGTVASMRVAEAPQIQRFPTVVAVAIFALDDPSWEVQMTEFLAQHLQGTPLDHDNPHEFHSSGPQSGPLSTPTSHPGTGGENVLPPPPAPPATRRLSASGTTVSQFPRHAPVTSR